MKLPVDKQAQVMELLATSRHPQAAGAIVEVLRLYRVDNKPGTRLDGAMAEVVVAAADMKLHEAAESVLRMFVALHVSWQGGAFESLASALENAAIVLADDAWEKELTAMLAAPIDPDGDHKTWRDQVPLATRRLTGARTLARRKGDGAADEAGAFAEQVRMSKRPPSKRSWRSDRRPAAVAKDVIADNNDELGGIGDDRGDAKRSPP